MFKRIYADIKKYRKYIIYSAKAELNAEVANSYLNWIWWILEPICFMLIYTFVFGYIFNAREQYFPAFIFIGITIWEFFNKNITNSIKMIKNNKNIVTKVYLPKYILVLSKMFVNGFKMLISFLIVIFLMIFYKVPFTLNIFWIFIIVLDLFIFTFGSMCILMHLGVFIADLSNVIRIVLRIMFYVTGVFYSIESRVGNTYPQLSNLLVKYNPLAFFITSSRSALLYNKPINFTMILIWFGISILLSLIGIRTIYKNENSYIKVI